MCCGRQKRSSFVFVGKGGQDRWYDRHQHHPWVSGGKRRSVSFSRAPPPGGLVMTAIIVLLCYNEIVVDYESLYTLSFIHIKCIHPPSSDPFFITTYLDRRKRRFCLLVSSVVLKEERGHGPPFPASLFRHNILMLYASFARRTYVAFLPKWWNTRMYTAFGSWKTVI